MTAYNRADIPHQFMGLTPGVKLGPYEVLSPLGAGGMGEVYKARDTRLEREVAIKVLPAHLASNADLRSRFEREAKTISSFQHPHICTLYDVGHQDGTDFLVMELLEGETLAKRLERGPVPLDQLLKIGIEIANALDKAHHAGIVHRDLKPGNVMLTKSGTKLMDFGLAKPAAMGMAVSGTVPVFSAALTIDSPASPITQQGTVIGTIQYMSPEQLQGKEADGRSDIFALGAVLYEMATGKRAFEGKSQLSVASAILEKDPEPISASQPLAPMALEQAVKTCLNKDPDERFQTAHDLRLQLGWIGPGGSTQPVAAGGGSSVRRLAPWIAVTALAAAALGATLAIAVRQQVKAEVFRISLLPPQKAAFQSTDLAFSRDGHSLAFVASGEAGSGIWVRQLNASNAKLLAGTEGAGEPFWSPDGKYLGFFADSKLKKVDVISGAIQTICEVPEARGGSWSETGMIIFSPSTEEPMFSVSADGGKPAPLTALDTQRREQSHRWPQFLPDGRFLFLNRNLLPDRATTGLYVGSPDSKEKVQLVQTEYRGAYAAGYLLFIRDRNLFAQRFDLKKTRLEGAPILLAEQVLLDSRWAAAFAASDSALAFHSGGSAGSQLSWFDRDGKSQGQLDLPQVSVFRMSPDAAKVVYSSIQGDVNDLWIYDLRKRTNTRFTFNPADEDDPQWTADGKTIVYDSTQRGQFDIYSKLADGSEEAKLVWQSPSVKYSTSLSRDGKYLAFDNSDPSGANRTDVYVLPLTGERKPIAFQATTAVEQFGEFSPDSKWIAFASNEAGRPEIYASPFPGGSVKYQVSQGGGSYPRWRRDGKEVYYVAPDLFLTAVEVNSTDRAFTAGAPKKLFRIGPNRSAYSFDVTPDGKRFLVNQFAGESIQPLSLYINWTQELEKK